MLLYLRIFHRCSESESGVNVVENKDEIFLEIWLLRPQQTFSTCFYLTVMLWSAWRVGLTWMNMSIVSSVVELAS